MKIWIGAAVVLTTAASSARAQTTARVSVDATGIEANGQSITPSISDDGRYVAFSSLATNLGLNDPLQNHDVFVRDRHTGAIECASVMLNGQAQGVGNFIGILSISGDGRFVAFVSLNGFHVAGDTNNEHDVFLRDLHLGTTERISVSSAGVEADDRSLGVAVPSFDGDLVLFTSEATNLVAGDLNAGPDVFLRTRSTGTTECISVDGAGAPHGGSTGQPNSRQMSADGRFVFFGSNAADYVPDDDNGVTDLFLRDRQLATNERVSLASTGDELNAASHTGSLSSDARYVVFTTVATNAVLGDTNGLADVFVRDRTLGTTEWLSAGVGGAELDAACFTPTISSDGRWVAFSSPATNLVVGDANGHTDVFLVDRIAATTTLVSRSTTGVAGDSTSSSPFVSADGRWIAFHSYATAMVAGDTNASADVIVDDTAVLAPVVAYCMAKVNSLGCKPFISSADVPSFGGLDGFFVTAMPVLAQKSGVFFWGLQRAAIPFGGGTLCVQPPLVRSLVQSSGGVNGCSGGYWFHFRQSYMAQKSLQPGDIVRGQFWSRDPGFAPPDNVGLSDAIEFTIGP